MHSEHWNKDVLCGREGTRSKEDREASWIHFIPSERHFNIHITSAMTVLRDPREPSPERETGTRELVCLPRCEGRRV